MRGVCSGCVIFISVAPAFPAPLRPRWQRRAPACLSGTVERGTCLLVVYGGPAAAWADGDAALPFHVRSGALPRLAEGWASGTLGPLGSEVFKALPRATLFRFDLPAAAAVALQVDGSEARVAPNSRELFAALPHAGQPPPARQRRGWSRPWTACAPGCSPGYAVEAAGAVEESAKEAASINKVMPLMLVVMLFLLMVQMQPFTRMLMMVATAPFGFVATLGCIALVGIIRATR